MDVGAADAGLVRTRISTSLMPISGTGTSSSHRPGSARLLRSARIDREDRCSGLVEAEREHPPRLDAHVRMPLGPRDPLGAVAGRVDFGQGGAESGDRRGAQIVLLGAAVDGDRERLALDVGRADVRPERMWRSRTESGAEPNQNAPRKKIPLTGPTIGRPSAVAVASASRRTPVKRAHSAGASSRRSGVITRRRWPPAPA